MLTAEQNAELTRVGPGTPMGELLRRYWYPVAFTRQLEEFPVKRVRLLGEDWALYRTPDGSYGVVEEQCPHRRRRWLTGASRPRGCAAATTAGCSAATGPASTSRPSSTRPRSRTGSGPGPAGPRSSAAWSGCTSARSRRRCCPATTST